MKRFLFAVLCFAGLVIYWGSVTTAQTVTNPGAFVVVDPMQRAALKEAQGDLDLAQLRYDNVLLRLRLALKVPNDYRWDRETRSFVAPQPLAMPSAKPTPSPTKQDNGTQ
jgi:hypothetical protein